MAVAANSRKLTLTHKLSVFALILAINLQVKLERQTL